MGFLIRWVCAFALLAASYNPTDWNFYRWVQTGWETQLPLTILFGLILLIGYIIYLRATLRSIGLFGLLLVLAVIGTAVWVLYDFEIIRLESRAIQTWLAITLLSFALAVGLGWSIVRRRISGQADVDDVDA